MAERSDADPLDLVLRIAADAASVLRERWGDPGVVSPKPDRELPGDVIRDLVTEVDTQVEALIANAIFAANPGALLLAEEGGARDADGQRCASSALGEADELWIVDPLDGTINFAHGLPGFCVSIARFSSGVPVAAAIVDPVVGETFAWSRDAGSTLDGASISVRDRPSIDSLLGIGSMPQDRRLPVMRSFRSWRRTGSAALNLAYVACGRLGAYVQYGNLNAWDVAAGVPLVLGAGGTVTKVGDGPWTWTFDGPQGLIAAAPTVHDEVTTILE